MPKTIHSDSVYDYVLSLVRAGRPVPDALFSLEQRAREELKREENRRRFPKTAALLDQVREIFPDAVVLSTEEVPVTPEDPTTA